MSGKIIGLGGRLRCGKGSLADVCEKHGYKRLYFALPLKEMCAQFMHASIDELNMLKNNNREIDFTPNDEMIEYFHEHTFISADKVEKVLLSKPIRNVRELLQVIGTDLIRKENSDWHVNQIRKMINPNEKYVLEDMRFPNEMKLVDDLGGDNWFIVRPKIDNVSHHISEEAIKWQNFGNKVIINNQSLEYMESAWDNFLDDYEKSVLARDKMIGEIRDNCSEWFNNDTFSVCDSLLISPFLFSYEKIDFDRQKIKSVEMDKSNCAFITYTSGVSEVITNPLNIEDLKFVI